MFIACYNYCNVILELEFQGYFWYFLHDHVKSRMSYVNFTRRHYRKFETWSIILSLYFLSPLISLLVLSLPFYHLPLPASLTSNRSNHRWHLLWPGQAVVILSTLSATIGASSSNKKSTLRSSSQLVSRSVGHQASTTFIRLLLHQTRHQSAITFAITVVNPFFDRQ